MDPVLRENDPFTKSIYGLIQKVRGYKGIEYHSINVGDGLMFVTKV